MSALPGSVAVPVNERLEPSAPPVEPPMDAVGVTFVTVTVAVSVCVWPLPVTRSPAT